MDKSELIPLRSKMNMPRLLKKDIYSEKQFWQLINLVFPLIIIVLVGLINQHFRKKKYVK